MDKIGNKYDQVENAENRVNIPENNQNKVLI